jgi:hypothetical protein
MEPTVIAVELVLYATNEEIIDKMMVMKSARETGFDHVICTVSGFGSDLRNLWDIPEVRALCRRIMTLGFPSYLDFSTTINNPPPIIRGGWGLAEVYLCAEGRLSPSLRVDHALLDELSAVMTSQNAIADAKLGAIKP